MFLSRIPTAISRLLIVCVIVGVAAVPSVASPPPAPPRLILFLVADQFPARYRERYHELFTGGLRTLFSEGTIFSRARHEHACTETCPGHATLATGSPPSIHGIVANEWFDKKADRPVYCASDDRHGTSPERLLASTIGDWLKTHSQSSRVYAVSGKDRAAVMLGGHSPSGVFWYDPIRGEFTTSSYYTADEPLLVDFHRKQVAARYNKPWIPLPQSPQLLARLGITTPSDFAPQLRLIPSIGERIYNTPFLDEATADIAEQLLVKKGLGQRDAQDMLLVSFSALDVVGHSYGSSALETVDTLVRLDAILGHLIQTAQSVAKGRLLVVFSSDHGIQAIPESPEGQAIGTRRVQPGDIQCSDRAVQAVKDPAGQRLLGPHHQGTDAFLRLSNPAKLKIAQQLELTANSCGWIETIRFPEFFSSTQNHQDDMQLLYSHAYFPGRGPDVFLQPKEHVVLRPYSGASHGTPYSYDTDVPVVFMGTGIGKNILNTPFPTTRVAPLLALLSGIPVPTKLLDKVSQSRMQQEYDGLLAN